MSTSTLSAIGKEVEIPKGFCQCGCGELTPLAIQTDRKRGWVKGEPLRFVHGHNGSSSTSMYIEDPDTGCWNWQRFRTPDGYGRLVRGSEQLAHRVFYIEAKGPIPEGLGLDHLCRNPSCINPDHLEPVTAFENHRRGLLTKLSWEKVREIRASKLSASELARQYGVTLQNIRRIQKNETWREGVV